MSRLVDRIRGDGRRDGVTDAHLGRERYDYAPDGIWVDGIHFGLDGQPPVAKSHGWGDLSWLRGRQRRLNE